jgi:uncharacterized protein
VDLTPLIPVGRQIIESYGDWRFRVGGVLHEGSVLVFPQQTLAWPVASMAELGTEDFAPIISRAAEIELLLLGCGPRLAMIPKDLRQQLRGQGIVMEPMDTGAAARTYNVLMAEGRHVAAALIAIE